MSFTPTWLPRHVRTRAYHVDNLVPIFVGESGRLAFRIEKAKSSEEEAPEAFVGPQKVCSHSQAFMFI